MRDINCHIFTFFFFFFLSESLCGATVEVCCCGCDCCCDSTSSSSGKRAYCKPGAEKQSFVKWPERVNLKVNFNQTGSNRKRSVLFLQDMTAVSFILLSYLCSRTLNMLCWVQPPVWSCCPCDLWTAYVASHPACNHTQMKMTHAWKWLYCQKYSLTHPNNWNQVHKSMHLGMQTVSTNICEGMGHSQELSEFQRGTVIGCHLCTYYNWKQFGTSATKPQSGRPCKMMDPASKPYISKYNAKRQMQWCKARRHWTLEQWRQSGFGGCQKKGTCLTALCQV